MPNQLPRIYVKLTRSAFSRRPPKAEYFRFWHAVRFGDHCSKRVKGINQNIKYYAHRASIVQTRRVFYPVSVLLSYLGHEEHNPLPEFWAKILPYRSSVEKPESRAAWGCGPCQKGELPHWTGLCFCVWHHKRAIWCSAWLETAPNEERKGAFLRQESIYAYWKTTEESRQCQ